ncbi:MAG TPA: DUF2911 domain-containing protein [Candidatus Acidoferrales bacterium]|jgi:hypothetical protein|nr:DUF2911 domain-containing protein [Candidatus Acidoferrales bacterium]
MKTNTVLLACALALGFAATTFAQAPKLEFPSPSPACTIKQRVGLTDIEIVYSRPGMKGRQIFGALVPFGEVWRTGANNATKITFSTPVKLNGQDVAAGSYALYTIPGEDEWTIILNKGVGKSGTQYDEKEDVLRFKTTPVHLADTSIETFTIEFNRVLDDSAVINIVWDKTVAPIKLQLDLVSSLLSQIDTVMASDSKNKPYFQAAAFYYDHGQDLKKASEWVDAAIKQREAYYIVNLKARILAKLGDKEGAIAAAKHSSELAVQAKEPSYVKVNDDLISSLK